MLNNLKSFIKNAPVIGPSLDHLRGKSFKNSAEYWDQRYKTGGNSGAGSYNRLAEFKAEILNEFVDQQQITSVIEYGTGDGAQLKLARYPSYTGVDISEKAVEMCRISFAGDISKRFLQSGAVTPGTVADLSLSLASGLSHSLAGSLYSAPAFLRLPQNDPQSRNRKTDSNGTFAAWTQYYEGKRTTYVKEERPHATQSEVPHATQMSMDT